MQLSRHSNKNMNSGGGGYEECSPFLLIGNKMDNLYNFLQADTDSILLRPYKFKEYEIKTLTVRQMMEINPYLVKIELDDFQESLREALGNLDENGQIEEPSAKELTEFVGRYAEPINSILTIIVGKDISREITSEEMVYAFAAVLSRLGGKHFMTSIRLAKNLSLQSWSGLIAAQEYLTSRS